MIYFLTFIALILIFSTGLWLWMNRTNAPVLRKMVDEDVQQELDDRQELSEQILPDEPEVNAKDNRDYLKDKS
ncbi:hypothetical protein [Desulfitibacter alkalitolerans]|uniref:hypothetical protein n=1 Tax=Desulfitibacter alkalitolerans TaxID=264641 RepID=UPI00048598C3|nr:hypothetical protein [Desulfitibacter alkalitolerans]